jgi:hypothetical protein
MASSTISRWLQWLMGRSLSDGFSHERTEHQLQDGSLAKRIRDDLEAAAFLDKQAFKQIRRPDGPPMRHREAQMGDTRRAALGLDAKQSNLSDGRNARIESRC